MHCEKLVHCVVAYVVRPSWADVGVDDFVAEDTAFFSADDEQGVVVVEGEG